MMTAMASGMRLSGITAIGVDGLELVGLPIDSQLTKDQAQTYKAYHDLFSRALRRTFPDYDLQALMGSIRESRKRSARKEREDSESIRVGAEN